MQRLCRLASGWGFMSTGLLSILGLLGGRLRITSPLDGIPDLCAQVTHLWPRDSEMAEATEHPKTSWLAQQGKWARQAEEGGGVGGSPSFLPGRPEAPRFSASAPWAEACLLLHRPNAGWNQCRLLCLRSP